MQSSARQRSVKQKRKVAEAQAELGDVVYYVRHEGATAIKIGYTGGLLLRLKNMGSNLAEVLAVEPGGPDLEQSRHEQFAVLRIISEYFRPGPDLLAHINELRAKANVPPVTLLEEP